MMQTMIMATAYKLTKGLKDNRQALLLIFSSVLIIIDYIYAARQLFNQNMYFTFVTVMHPPVQVIVACPPLGTSFWFCSPGLV